MNLPRFNITDPKGHVWTVYVGPDGDRVAARTVERARAMARALWAGAQVAAEAPVAVPVAAPGGRQCPRCGSLEFAQVSSCKAKCQACGLEDGGCS